MLRASSHYLAPQLLQRSDDIRKLRRRRELMAMTMMRDLVEIGSLPAQFNEQRARLIAECLDSSGILLLARDAAHHARSCELAGAHAGTISLVDQQKMLRTGHAERDPVILDGICSLRPPAGRLARRLRRSVFCGDDLLHALLQQSAASGGLGRGAVMARSPNKRSRSQRRVFVQRKPILLPLPLLPEYN